MRMGSRIIPSTSIGSDLDDHFHASVRMAFLFDLQRFREKILAKNICWVCC